MALMVGMLHAYMRMFKLVEDYGAMLHHLPADWYRIHCSPAKWEAIFTAILSRRTRPELDKQLTAERLIHIFAPNMTSMLPPLSPLPLRGDQATPAQQASSLWQQLAKCLEDLVNHQQFVQELNSSMTYSSSNTTLNAIPTTPSSPSIPAVSFPASPLAVPRSTGYEGGEQKEARAPTNELVQLHALLSARVRQASEDWVGCAEHARKSMTASNKEKKARALLVKRVALLLCTCSLPEALHRLQMHLAQASNGSNPNHSVSTASLSSFASALRPMKRSDSKVELKDKPAQADQHVPLLPDLAGTLAPYKALTELIASSLVPRAKLRGLLDSYAKLVFSVRKSSTTLGSPSSAAAPTPSALPPVTQLTPAGQSSQAAAPARKSADAFALFHEAHVLDAVNAIAYGESLIGGDKAADEPSLMESCDARFVDGLLSIAARSPAAAQHVQRLAGLLTELGASMSRAVVEMGSLQEEDKEDNEQRKVIASAAAAAKKGGDKGKKGTCSVLLDVSVADDISPYS